MSCLTISEFLRVIYKTNGAEEDRTPDLLVANQAFSQLNYGPKWAKVESNHRPYPYQGYALTN